MIRLLSIVIMITISSTAFSRDIYESQGQVHRPERVNQCTCPYDPTKGILILSIKITK